MSYGSRIRELEEERRKNLRQVERAKDRRKQALRERRWEDARSALRVVRHNRAEAQQNLEDIRTIRRHREAANRLARTLRHRRFAGYAADGGRLYWFDGRKVRAEIYPHLVWARANGWKGVVTSGYRDPVYSTRLCYAMCGRPFCPGRCAGTSSNHVRIAVDVTDYYTFAELMRRCPHKPRIFNDLPYDRVHFSPNGH